MGAPDAILKAGFRTTRSATRHVGSKWPIRHRYSITSSNSAPIAGGYWDGCTIPFRENLQEISKDIQDVLQVGFKPAISSAVRPRQSMIHRVEQRQPRPTYGRASERILPHPAA